MCHEKKGRQKAVYFYKSKYNALIGSMGQHVAFYAYALRIQDPRRSDVFGSALICDYHQKQPAYPFYGALGKEVSSSATSSRVRSGRFIS